MQQSQQFKMDIQSNQNDKKSNKHRVKVAIRVRPMVQRQIINNDYSCVVIPDQRSIILGKQRYYKFDNVFSEKIPQKEVYQQCVKDLAKSCFQGYNAAIMAYGQTGSGKTYTMGTASNISKSKQELGIIRRVVQDIFDQVQIRKNKAQFLIKASFLEIYNQRILDLLVESKQQQKQSEISIRQEKDGSVSIYGINQIKVNNPQQLIYLLQKGGAHRSTSETLMNSASSRSHAIFTITIQQHITQDLYKANQKTKPEEIDQGFMTAKFVFVDLAGSQRAKKTGATGATLKEGININLGLLELGNVISALSQQKKDKFITYRNSKLTRILQDSLGGNSNTYMIACISPSQSNFEQSLNTLKYASKAMNIKNKPIVNRDPHSALVSQLRQTIFQLQTQNRKLRSQLSGLGVNISQSRNFEQNDVSLEELKKLKSMYLLLQKKFQEANQQLKQQKKKKNQLQILTYELKRDRDYAWLKIQAMASVSQDLKIQQEIKGKTKILQQYQQKITELQALVQDKQKMNIQYVEQYERLKKSSEKDQGIFRQKNKKIHVLKRQNKDLSQYIHKLHSQIQLLRKNAGNSDCDKIDNKLSLLPRQNLEEQQQVIASDSQLDDDENYKMQSENFSIHAEEHLSKLKNVDKFISEKQAYLNQMTQQQIQLQYQLINQMKEEYYKKIVSIQKQKQILLQKHREEVSNGNERGLNRHIQKIQTLQQQLKQYRKKAKDQTNLQKMVNVQNNKIKQLANEIKEFKIQKIELSRKMKEEKENFKQYKNQRIKEAMKNKKENFKQDLKIRKLKFQNQKKTQRLCRKQEQLKRMKRINEALKQFVKPKSVRKKAPPNDNLISFKQNQFRMIVEESIKKILITIDKEIQVQRYETKIQDIEAQLDQLLCQQSAERLKFQRKILLHQSQQLSQSIQQQQTQVKLFDLKERIQNCEQSLQFCKEKYEEIISQGYKMYDAESDIVFNRAYESVDHLRHILKYLYRMTRIILEENYKIKQKKEQLDLEILSLNQKIQCLNEKITQTNTQHQENLAKIRQQMLVKYYASLEEVQPQNIMMNNNKSLSNIAPIRLDEKQRKSYERKIVDLTKTNRQIAAEVEMWRRKCTIVQDKYNSMKNLVHKDKFIGIGRNIKDEEANIIRQRKNLPVINNKNNHFSTMQEVSSMLQSMNSMSTFKNKKNRGEQSDQFQKIEQEEPYISQEPQFNKNKWQCLTKIDAHTSGILSLATYSNILISSASRSLKIWDIQTNKLIADLSAIHLQNFVKHISVNHQRKIMAVACDKQVSIWDLSTLNTEYILKSHKDQVKHLHHHNDYLFSGGKGSQTGGAILVWDYRYLNPNAPLDQKEKNQDVFTITSSSDTLYYGTRNHQVRRMNLQNFEILAPFEPPHMDTVTGLTIIKNNLISGSKDKNLKLWSLASPINNLKCTIHASNDYINTIQNDTNLPVFYSGSRDGQIKIGALSKEKIQLIGGITAHTQSVNSICPLYDNKMSTFATGSSDKTIRIWQPTKQTLQNINVHYPF